MFKRLALTLILFLFLFILCPSANSPRSVIQFYSGLKTLESAKNTDIANATQQNMAACFMASDQSGINLSMDGMGEMTSNLYTMKLYNMIYNEKSLRINSYNITRTEIVEQPDQNSRMERNGAQHYVSYVTKQYVKDGKTITYNDVVFTLISNGYITEMTNVETLGNITKVNVPLSIEQLRTRAAYYYSKGKYTQAYDYYEQLVTRTPTDGDACYRIALLTFWRKGCKDKFRKSEAKKKAEEYINKAITYGNSEIQKKATNVSRNWENSNVYF